MGLSKRGYAQRSLVCCQGLTCDSGLDGVSPRIRWSTGYSSMHSGWYRPTMWNYCSHFGRNATNTSLCPFTLPGGAPPYSFCFCLSILGLAFVGCFFVVGIAAHFVCTWRWLTAAQHTHDPWMEQFITDNIVERYKDDLHTPRSSHPLEPGAKVAPRGATPCNLFPVGLISQDQGKARRRQGRLQ